MTYWRGPHFHSKPHQGRGVKTFCYIWEC